MSLSKYRTKSGYRNKLGLSLLLAGLCLLSCFDGLLLGGQGLVRAEEGSKVQHPRSAREAVSSLSGQQSPSLTQEPVGEEIPEPVIKVAKAKQYPLFDGHVLDIDEKYLGCLATNLMFKVHYNVSSWIRGEDKYPTAWIVEKPEVLMVRNDGACIPLCNATENHSKLDSSPQDYTTRVTLVVVVGSNKYMDTVTVNISPSSKKDRRKIIEGLLVKQRPATLDKKSEYTTYRDGEEIEFDAKYLAPEYTIPDPDNRFGNRKVVDRITDIQEKISIENAIQRHLGLCESTNQLLPYYDAVYPTVPGVVAPSYPYGNALTLPGYMIGVVAHQPGFTDLLLFTNKVRWSNKDGFGRTDFDDTSSLPIVYNKEGFPPYIKLKMKVKDSSLGNVKSVNIQTDGKDIPDKKLTIHGNVDLMKYFTTKVEAIDQNKPVETRVIWKSTNPEIADIDPNTGELIPLQQGETTIQAISVADLTTKDEIAVTIDTSTYRVKYGTYMGESMPEEYVPIGQLYTFPKCKYTSRNQLFSHWVIFGDTSHKYQPGDTYALTDSIFVHAAWDDLVLFTFDPNGGTKEMPPVKHSSQDPNGYQVPVCAFGPPPNKEFSYWTVEGEPKTKTYAPGDTFPVTRHAKFIANWKDIATPITKYTVSYDANTGNGTMASVKVKEGESYSFPDCSFTAPAGKTFSHWTIKDETPSKKYKPNDSRELTGDITVVANWVRIIQLLKDESKKGDIVVSIHFPEDLPPHSTVRFMAIDKHGKPQDIPATKDSKNSRKYHLRLQFNAKVYAGFYDENAKPILDKNGQPVRLDVDVTCLEDEPRESTTETSEKRTQTTGATQTTQSTKPGTALPGNHSSKAGSDGGSTSMGRHSSQLISRNVTVAPAGPGNQFYINAPDSQSGAKPGQMGDMTASAGQAGNPPVVANKVPQTGEKSFFYLTLGLLLGAGVFVVLRKKLSF